MLRRPSQNKPPHVRHPSEAGARFPTKKTSEGDIVEGTLTDEDKAHIDLFKFFVDKGFAEATLFYTRVTTILGLQAVLAGFVLSNAKELTSLMTNPQMRLLFALGAGAGAFINLMLFFVSKKSIVYSRGWLGDAATLRISSKILKETVQQAVATPGLASESQSSLVTIRLAVSFWQWRVTTWFLVLAILLCGVWCGVLWIVFQFK